MMQCSVYDKTTGESEVFYSITAAKRWMRVRAVLGHEVSGTKTEIYQNGDRENCGEIELTKSKKAK